MTNPRGERKPIIPPCGCGGDNRRPYGLTHLIAMLEREEQARTAQRAWKDMAASALQAKKELIVGQM